MTAICLVCTFVCLFCTVFNAIVIKKLGKLFTQFFEMKDKLESLSSISSSLSGMGLNINK